MALYVAVSQTHKRKKKSKVEGKRLEIIGRLKYQSALLIPLISPKSVRVFLCM